MTVNAKVSRSGDPWGRWERIRLDVDLPDRIRIPARAALVDRLELRWHGMPGALARIRVSDRETIEIDPPPGMTGADLPDEIEIVAVVSSNGRRVPVGP